MNIIKNLDEKILNSNHDILKEQSFKEWISLNTFFDIYYIFAGGNVNLNDAINEKLDLRGWSCDDEEKFRLFLRVEHLKSCILSYNSIEDYILKIVTFEYNLKGKKISSKTDYINKQKKICYDYVIKNKKNREKIESCIVSILKKYHNDKDIKEIRRICNGIKHGRSYRFKGLPTFSNGIAIKNKEFSTVWLEPDREDINTLIKRCLRVNKKIKKYVEDIYSIIATKYDLNKI